METIRINSPSPIISRKAHRNIVIPIIAFIALFALLFIIPFVPLVLAYQLQLGLFITTVGGLIGITIVPTTILVFVAAIVLSCLVAAIGTGVLIVGYFIFSGSNKKAGDLPATLPIETATDNLDIANIVSVSSFLSAKDRQELDDLVAAVKPT